MNRAELMEMLNDDLTALKEKLARLDGVLLGEGYVLMSNGMALAFDIDDQRRLSNPRPVGLDGTGYLMLAKEEAERIAANVFDGGGKPAEAMHIRAALQQAIADQTALIENLTSK